MNFSELEKKINYVFKNKDYIEQAMRHTSYCNDKKLNKIDSNERVEFLGDAVLELVVSEFLFNDRKDMPEGDLTKLRASIVCEPTLAQCAKEINLPEFLLLGKGERVTGGAMRDSIVSDAFEALIGAIYLDGGFTSAKDFIYTYVLSDIEAKKLFYDSKTILQEIVQKDYKTNVTYKIISENGPDHQKEFTVGVYLNDEILGTGVGTSKKNAEQKAAYEAVMKFKKTTK